MRIMSEQLHHKILSSPDHFSDIPEQLRVKWEILFKEITKLTEDTGIIMNVRSWFLSVEKLRSEKRKMIPAKLHDKEICFYIFCYWYDKIRSKYEKKHPSKTIWDRLCAEEKGDGQDHKQPGLENCPSAEVCGSSFNGWNDFKETMELVVFGREIKGTPPTCSVKRELRPPDRRIKVDKRKAQEDDYRKIRREWRSLAAQFPDKNDFLMTLKALIKKNNKERANNGG
jgi:hypothetical protein